jgi:hypothetical protein
MWNKRRNEYLRIKHTEKYQQDPAPWEELYQDVNDAAVSGLVERADGEQYTCGDNRLYRPYKTKRSAKSGRFISTGEANIAVRVYSETMKGGNENTELATVRIAAESYPSSAKRRRFFFTKES